MFVLILDYKADLAEVDRHLAAHLDWLKATYAAGSLIASGRRVPRTGGVLLARGDRATAEALAASDPFSIHGVADYTIIEFTPTMTAPGFEALAQ